MPIPLPASSHDRARARVAVALGGLVLAFGCSTPAADLPQGPKAEFQLRAAAVAGTIQVPAGASVVRVFLADAAMAPFPGVPAVQANGAGQFTLTGVPVGQTFVVAARIRDAEGKEGTLATLVRAGDLGTRVEVGVASTLVTALATESAANALGDYKLTSFKAASALVAEALAGQAAPSLADPLAVLAKAKAIVQGSAEARAAVNDLRTSLGAGAVVVAGSVPPSTAASPSAGPSAGPPSSLPRDEESPTIIFDPLPPSPSVAIPSPSPSPDEITFSLLTGDWQGVGAQQSKYANMQWCTLVSTVRSPTLALTFDRDGKLTAASVATIIVQPEPYTCQGQTAESTYQHAMGTPPPGDAIAVDFVPSAANPMPIYARFEGALSGLSTIEGQLTFTRDTTWTITTPITLTR